MVFLSYDTIFSFPKSYPNLGRYLNRITSLYLFFCCLGNNVITLVRYFLLDMKKKIFGRYLSCLKIRFGG